MIVPDDSLRKILSTAARRNPGGQLLVADAVIKPGNDADFGKILDLEMLVLPGGRERTEQQFGELFSAAGWRLSRVIHTRSPVSIVEGVPARAFLAALVKSAAWRAEPVSSTMCIPVLARSTAYT